MIIVETSGSWRDMGVAYARAVGEAIVAIMRNDAPTLLAGKAPPQAAEIRRRVAQHVPHLIDETGGMSSVLGIPAEALLCYRLLNDVRSLGPLTHECSCLAIRDGETGPLLARTCDIESRNHAFQELRVCRPDDGLATISVGYAGWITPVALNAAGLGSVGGSAKPARTYDGQGIGSQMLGHAVTRRCITTREAAEKYGSTVVNGKGAVEIVGDAGGEICLVETVNGAVPRCTFLDARRNELVVPNLFYSRDIKGQKTVGNWYNAYARYGRMAHELLVNPDARSVAGAQQLMRDVAQPSAFVPEGAMSLTTAYATVFDLRNRVCYLSRGNPNRVAFEAFAIEPVAGPRDA